MVVLTQGHDFGLAVESDRISAALHHLITNTGVSRASERLHHACLVGVALVFHDIIRLSLFRLNLPDIGDTSTLV